MDNRLLLQMFSRRPQHLRDPLSDILARMLQLAGYDSTSTHCHLAFFRTEVKPFLRVRQHGFGSKRFLQWHSFMTDDHEPIEFSWSWNNESQLPTVRYSLEPISVMSGSRSDPTNLRTASAFIDRIKAFFPSANWKWYDILSKVMLCSEKQISPDSGSPSSQVFFAFDLLSTGEMPKVYLIPTERAKSEGISNLELTIREIFHLGLDESLLSAVGLLTQYLYAFPRDARPAVELVGFDCVNPLKSRLKIYVRSCRTSFLDVIDALMLGGRIQDHKFEECVLALEHLWTSVLGLNSPLDRHQQLPWVDHQTAGILYYYEFKPFSKVIKTKLYIPVRHYTKNDFIAASGFAELLESQHLKLKGLDYLDAVQTIWCEDSYNVTGRANKT